MKRSCITVVIPLAVDAAIDFCAQAHGTTTAHLKERFLFSLALALPSLFYLIYRETPMIASIYVAVMSARNIALIATIHSAGDEY